MSNCSVCGTLEYWHSTGQVGSSHTAYCPKCQPQKTTLLPLDEGSDYDIEESEIAHLEEELDRLSALPGYPDPVDIHGQPAPAKGVNASGPPVPKYQFKNDPNTGIQSAGSDVSFGSGGSTTISSDLEVVGPKGSKQTSLSLDGSRVIIAYDELPETAKQGQMGCIKGEGVSYIFDGEEWQNLGEALLGKKRNVLTPKDEKIDRRAAVAATKAKNEEL